MPTFDQQVSAILDKKLDEITEFIYAESQINLEKNGTTDTGFLAETSNVNLKKFLDKEIVYSAPYAINIEYGSEPHPVNLKTIVNPNKKGKKNIQVPVLYDWTRRKLGKSAKDAVGVSYAIAHKIKLRGTEPQPFLRPAMQSAKARYGR